MIKVIAVNIIDIILVVALLPFVPLYSFLSELRRAFRNFAFFYTMKRHYRGVLGSIRGDIRRIREAMEVVE